MIDFLKNWVMNIVTIVIFIVLLEILIPSGKTKKFVNLVSGFILIIAIINPFLGALGKGINLTDLQISTGSFLDRKEIESDSKLLNDTQMKQVAETYRRKLIRQLEASAGEVKGVGNVEADVIIDEDYTSDKFGEIKRVYLTIGNGSQNTGVKPVARVERVEIGKNIKKNTGENTKKVDGKIKKQLEDKISSLFEIQKENIVIQAKAG